MIAPAKLPDRWTVLEWHPKQAAFYRSPARFNVVEAGRRSGKTEACKRRKVRRAIRHGFPGYRCLLGAPTQAQAEAIWFDDIHALARHRIASVKLSKCEIHLDNGAHFKIAGLDEARRFEGVPVDDGAVDEIADCRPDVWDKTLRPLVDTKGRPGSLDFIGVPRPSPLFSRLADMAQSGVPDWAYFHWTSEELLAPEAIAAAKRDMDPRLYAQEYLASRVNVAGRVCHAWDKTIHVADQLPYNPDAPLIFALDFNVEPGPACVGQEHMLEGGEVMTDWIGEVHIPHDSHTRLVCQKLIADWGKHRGEVLLDGDPAGGARSTTASDGGSNWRIAEQVMREHFGERVHVMRQRAAPKVLDRINAWNARLLTADGKPHMRFHRTKAKQLIADCENVQWKQGADYEIDKKDLGRTHWLDGASYYVARKYPINGGVMEVQSVFG